MKATAYILEGVDNPNHYKKGNGFTNNFANANTYLSKDQAIKSGNMFGWGHWKVVKVEISIKGEA